MSVAIDIIVTAKAWKTQNGLEALTETTVRQCVLTTGVKLARGCELSVNFCGDSAIRALNARWRGKDEATNVLSFATPGALAAKLALGDIVIAYETVEREAKEQDKAFRDHVTHMIVHGFLHLIGYDHETPPGAEAMEALERRVALALGLKDPYEGTLPAGDGAATNGTDKANVDQQ